jgi:hypothetical protein
MRTSTDSNSSPLDDAAAWMDHRASNLAQRAARARNASGRRRLVDPATCERYYSPAELEFMQAMQEYKTRTGRLYPTWGEVLAVVERLGYQKRSQDAGE